MKTASKYRFLILKITLVCFLICGGSYYSSISNKAYAQQVMQQKNQPLTRILFLFDASQSMYGRWQSGMKIDIAKRILSELLDSLKHIDNLEVALRVYGHLKNYPPQDCNDTRLEVPFSKHNFGTIKEKLKTITPKGTTPIARSLEACGEDFPPGPSRNIIILITDGIEECNGDPCAVSLTLQKRGIVLKPFVIGLGLNQDYLKTFECVGTYYDASNEITFKNILNVVISQALNSTTMQVNLIDAYGKATETNVNMTFYDNFSGAIKYNFVHTFNERGNPDTLKIDPLSTYKIVVHTIPPVEKDSIALNPGKHTIVGIDAPQGYLSPKFEGISEYKKLSCIVRKAGEMKTLHVQDFNTIEKYIVGKYDLEVLCLPRMNINNVEISQSHTTTVQIPQPGIITILSNAAGYGSIYIEEKNTLKWVYSLNTNSTKETIVLQPGNYRVIYRPKNAKESIYTIERPFRITSGGSNSVTLY